MRKFRAVFLSACIGLIVSGAARIAFGDKLTITVDIDGGKVRSVTVDPLPAVDPPAPPATKPIDPPATQPTTQPAPPAAGLYSEIGGIPGGAKAVASGDVSKLSGNVLLTGGDYTASGGISANLYDPTPDTPATVAIASGHQVDVSAGVKLGGIHFVGGGLAKDTNGKNAAVVVNDRCELHSVEVTKAAGVGILFQGGDQSGGVFTPARIKSFDLHAHHNGTSGRMIRARGDNVTPGSGFHEVRSELAFNNHGGKKSDAANKGTQTSDYLGEDLWIHDEADGGQWFDIACWNVILRNPRIERITTETDWYRAVGIRWELNAFGTYPSGVYGGFIGDLAGSAVAANESGNVEVVGVHIGACRNALELRQLTRDDDPGDGGTDPAKWLTDKARRVGPGRPGAPKGTPGWYVYRVVFKQNTLADKAGPLMLSDAGGDTKKIRQAANAITITGNTGNVNVKIPG